MRPSPQEVASQVTTILGSPWPDGLGDSLPWLQTMGFSTETAQERSPEGASCTWEVDSMREWDTALAGWSTYREQFAGLFWFLWDDLEWEVLVRDGAKLAHAMTDAHGAPEKVTEATAHHGANWLWRLPEHTIDMYAHNGAIRPDGFPPGPSVLQLQVDLRAVAEPRDAEERELSAARSGLPAQARTSPS